MENSNKEQISDDIDYAGNADKNKRKIGITHTSQDTADHIIGDNDQDTAGTDADIGDGFIVGSLRHLEQ